ncbi:NlpC/P60 family protein [Streptomyces sp. NPDC007905]|uniref:C40 family peptidase n=1 Tax=Streptomyces sp. NPDC007905 TaxID=3364788 RepID=UPI0036EA7948
MASHRKPRPGGTLGPGLRTPALATAAFTSVAVLSQTAEAAPADDSRPSLEEIEKKVDEFYRRAESPTERSDEATERAGRQRGRLDTLLAKVPFADDPQEQAHPPLDYFHQSRVMDRLASTVKKRQETSKVIETPDGPAYDPNSAKAAVQRKLASARELMSRLTAQEEARPAAPGQGRREETAAPSYGSSAAQATRAEKAIAFARAQIGKPYVSGASGPGSYDCSGLTQAAWKAAGVTLPRTARDQASTGTRVSLADAHPGDLVFFHDDLSHVGLCTGNGMMIHAPRPGAYIREESVHHGGESVIHSVVRPA